MSYSPLISSNASERKSEEAVLVQLEYNFIENLIMIKAVLDSPCFGSEIHTAERKFA